MKLEIHSIGTPKLPYARLGLEEYFKRVRTFGKAEFVPHRAALKRSLESRALLDATEGAIRVVLDERGKQMTSKAIAKALDGWQNSGVKRVTFLIGGAGGHEPAVREEADAVWSLGGLTLQHELALVVLLEQIYRGFTILRGLPYHRE